MKILHYGCNIILLQKGKCTPNYLIGIWRHWYYACAQSTDILNVFLKNLTVDILYIIYTSIITCFYILNITNSYTIFKTS